MNATRKTCLQLSIIALGTTLGTAWTYYYKADRPALYLAPITAAYDEISLDEALTLKSPLIWIDARSDAEFAKAHVPDAISLNPVNAESMMKTHFELFMDQRKAFVIYGPDDASSAVANKLDGLGLKKVHRLRGGWKAWQAHQS